MNNGVLMLVAPSGKEIIHQLISRFEVAAAQMSKKSKQATTLSFKHAVHSPPSAGSVVHSMEPHGITNLAFVCVALVAIAAVFIRSYQSK